MLVGSEEEEEEGGGVEVVDMLAVRALKERLRRVRCGRRRGRMKVGMEVPERKGREEREREIVEWKKGWRVSVPTLFDREDRKGRTALDECHDAMIIADAVEMGGTSQVNPLRSATLFLRSRVGLPSSSHRTIGMNTLTGSYVGVAGELMSCLGQDFLSIRDHLRRSILILYYQKAVQSHMNTIYEDGFGAPDRDTRQG